MAKIGKHRVSVLLLLAVLAVAVSLQAAHRVSAAGGATAAIERLAKFKKPAEWVKRIIDSGDKIADWRKKKDKSSHHKLPEGLYYFSATSIRVAGESIGSGEAIVSAEAHVAFLDNKAYGLLKASLPTPTADSKFGDQLCYTGTADQLSTVTLVFPAAGEKTGNLWYSRSTDEPTCLPILPFSSIGLST